ncbi:zf-HC2 domain-containing protein [bacterium]|nr:zf-HC2 domain-containing protein [bacterium]
MNCYQVREKVEPYLDMGLPEPEAQSLKKHLERCPECQQEVETIRKIDSFVKMDLFEPPPREYWANVPKRVTEQLGLWPQRPKLLGIFDSIQGMLVTPAFKWGGTLAVAGLATFFLLRGLDTQDVISTSDPVASDHSLRNQASTTEESIQPARPSAIATAPERVAPNRNNPSGSIPQVEDSPSRQVLSTPLDGEKRPEEIRSFEHKQTILAKAVVVKAQPKKVISDAFEFDRALFPDAGSSFRLSLTQSDKVAKNEDKETNPRTFTLVRGGRGAASSTNNQGTLEDTDRLSQDDESGANDFFQTLLIVEDTKKLSEKRNIWLSYVGRESNQTYRSLGIYRLADICYRIAHESRDEELATKALSLYEKYERTLKSLMGVEAYNAKVIHIQGLIDTN